MNYDVFISYSRKDKHVADRICAAFDNVGISYFIDRQGIGGGFEFPTILAEAIIRSKVVLYLASVNSYESKFTNSELTFAFNEKPANSVLPYIIDGSQMPPALRLVFSSVTWRTIEECAIETNLIRDIKNLLGKSASQSTSSYTSPEELRKRGNDAYDQKRYYEAIDYYRKAAVYGDPWAEWNLGTCYGYGLGVKLNLEESEKWFTRAAGRGVIDLQYMLGDNFNYGKGVVRNLRQAAYWYKRAADQGHDDAQIKLGICYLYGKGVPEDNNIAIALFKMAATQGNRDAKSRLHDLGVPGY